MRLFVVPVIILTLTVACSSLKLEPADFSWPIESVLKIDKDGFVKEERHSLYFNTKALFAEEAEDSLAYTGKEIRIIRNADGFYFITSKGFKNVYIFRPSEASLELKEKVFITENGLSNPFLNQRNPYIELVDGDYKGYLTSEGLKGGVK